MSTEPMPEDWNPEPEYVERGVVEGASDPAAHKIFSQAEETVKFLAERWAVDLEPSESPRVNVRNGPPSVNNKSINLSSPSYIEKILENWEGGRMGWLWDQNSPLPVWQVWEETGQYIGEKANSSWNYEMPEAEVAAEGSLDDFYTHYFSQKSRDELNGALAVRAEDPHFARENYQIFRDRLEAITESTDQESLSEREKDELRVETVENNSYLAAYRLANSIENKAYTSRELIRGDIPEDVIKQDLSQQVEEEAPEYLHPS